MGYCFIIGLIIAMAGYDFGVGIFIGAFITIVVGVASFSGTGPMMPVVQNNTNQNAVDASNVRRAMEVDSMVNESENQLGEGNMFRALHQKKGSAMENISYSGMELVKELIYRRSALQLIVAGCLVAVLAFMPYIKYFI